MAHIAIRGIDQRGGVEVAVVMTEKRRNGRGRRLGHDDERLCSEWDHDDGARERAQWGIADRDGPTRKEYN